MAGLIVPRPIAFVSTLGRDGSRNLAPFSYFMPGGVNPPTLAFCPVLDAGGTAKDTLRNIRETGEFVVNLVHRSMAEGMNATAASFPSGESEWPASGFTPVESTRVAPPGVGESRVRFECILFGTFPTGAEAGAGTVVVGRILACHAAEDPGMPIARLGASGYLDLAAEGGGKVFDLPRPVLPPKSS